jgi:hypothetical protein
VRKLLPLTALFVFGLTVPAFASHSLTTGTGQGLHQVSNAGTALDRTVNIIEDIPSPTTTPGLYWHNYFTGLAAPQWSKSTLINMVVSGTSQEPYGSCTDPNSNGDVRVCTAWPLAQGTGATTFISYTAAGHITRAHMLIDDFQSGASHPGDTCTMSTLDEATGQQRNASTNCGTFAECAAVHEMGHVLGLAHPVVGYSYYGPMGCGYLWQATQGCSYDTPPPGVGHACYYPEAHDYNQLSLFNHVDATGPTAGAETGGTTTGLAAKNVKNYSRYHLHKFRHRKGVSLEDIDAKNLPRDNQWHKISRLGGAFYPKHGIYSQVRLRKDGSGDFREVVQAPKITHGSK